MSDRIVPPDYDAYFVALDRIKRLERRERLHQQLAVVKAAQAAGFLIGSTVIEGVPLTFSQPEPAKPAEDEPPRAALFQTRTHPKMKVIL